MRKEMLRNRRAQPIFEDWKLIEGGATCISWAPIERRQSISQDSSKAQDAEAADAGWCYRDENTEIGRNSQIGTVRSPITFPVPITAS
jgi:hypothetical protein